MTDQLLHLNVRGTLPRVLLLLPLLLVLTGAWFSVRWFVGNTLAENVRSDDRGFDTAKMAVGLAPSDPLAHWTLAELQQRQLSMDQAGTAVAEYEQAVKLAPHDYRFWLAWGRALEQAGDIQKGEQVMRHAVALAPAYSYPRWYLGNLLLRDGREVEAFKELRNAAEANPELRPQVFNLVWKVYEKSPADLSTAVGSDAVTRAEFAKYLLDRNQIDAGLTMWRGLSASDKKANWNAGEGLVKILVDGKHFPQALEISNDLASTDSARAHLGEVFDGSFEKPVSTENHSTFSWEVKTGQQAQAGVDKDVKHGGSQSLRITFKARSVIDLAVSQLIVVQSSTQYDFEGFLKTNKLESAATPVIEIVDATDGTVLATSEAAPTGLNDWQRFPIAFRTGPKTEGVLIRLNRTSCGDNTSCPIFGTLWYDDFTIKRRS